MVREPAVAGQFYPALPAALKRQIESMVDKNAKKEKAIGIISPHAGYIYSGAVAAALYSRIEITDTVIILGPNHTGTGSAFSLYDKGRWEMPFGEISIDEEMASDIASRCSLIKKEQSAHLHEHSLEVQIPFMQYFKKYFKIVPIVVSAANMQAYQKVGDAIAQAVKDGKKDVLIVASSDMTHYEPQKSALEKDKMAIDAVLNLDEKELLRKVDEYDITMCGCIPAAIMIIAAKLLGAKKGELIKYQTSGDASGDYSSVVGYAGIMVK